MPVAENAGAAGAPDRFAAVTRSRRKSPAVDSFETALPCRSAKGLYWRTGLRTMCCAHQLVHLYGDIQDACGGECRGT